jgi:uncharacterized protein YjbI with pentapeptide repeats
MRTEKEVDNQKDLLATHRSRLAHYLKTRATLGDAYAPPHVTTEIDNARAEIRRVKDILQKWGVSYEDHPDDVDQSLEPRPEGLANLNELSIKVKEIFETCGYSVQFSHQQDRDLFDIEAKKAQGLDRRPLYIKCSTSKASNNHLQQLAALRNRFPHFGIYFIAEEAFDSAIITQSARLGIECRTYQQVVDQMINFDPYIQAVLQDSDLNTLAKEYELPYIESQQGRHLAWNFLDSWLANPESNWLTVLGDYGVGKSALLQMLLLRLTQRFRDDPENSPIPILVPLQNYIKSFTFRNLILALFEEIGLKGVYYDAFSNWVKRGKIILLLDSFDEMAQKLNRYEIHNNLRELLGGISGSSKAILTSRPTYFESNAERLQLFSHSGRVSNEDFHLHQKYSEFDQILQDRLKNTTECQIEDLTDEQRKRFFRRVLKDNPQALLQIEKLIERTSGLDNLSSRPAIARLLMTAIPALRTNDMDALPDDLNEASLFKLIVNALLQRDENLFGEFLSNTERHDFLKELAYIISRRQQDYFVDNKIIRTIVEQLFRQKIEAHETPDIISEQYFRTCRRAAGLSVQKTALGITRDVEDPESRIGFSHNALREFLYAEFIYENLFQERAEKLFFGTALSDGTLNFLRHMLSEQSALERLISYINSFNRIRDFYFQIAWQILPNRDRENIVAIFGDPPDFSELDLGNQDFSDRDLSDADFSNSLIGGVNFRGTILDGAIFRNAILERVAFDNASLIETDFSDAEVRSIVVYDKRQKRLVEKYDVDARQWLYTEGSEFGAINELNRFSRSRKYRVAHRILQKMARYNFIKTHNEQGLLRGLGQEEPIGRQFLEALHRHGYLRVVRKAMHGGRGADVIHVEPTRRGIIQQLFDGDCPSDLLGFFDDLPTS